MEAAMIAAHDLAHELEWMRAKELAKLSRRPGFERQRAEHLFDPLAATCLGDLIYDRITRALHEE